MDTSPLDDEEWKTVIAYSHAHIALVDEAIGRVLDAIDRLGLADSTAVVFASDHGDMEGAHNRFDKGAYFYEEVWRIPLIIRMPDAVPATQDAFVSLLDIGETLFSLIGAESPSDQPRAGRDLLPLVGVTTRPSGWDQVAYGVYYRYNGYSFEVRAIRNARYKYVWNPQATDEFYDLQTDPHEMKNLSGQPQPSDPENDLRDQLLAWLCGIGDDLPDRLDRLPPAGSIIATGKQGP